LAQKKSHRQHPIKILSYTTKYFWLLSIPLVRGLILLKFNLQVWLEGAWVDIFVLFLILLFAIIRWLCITFDYDSFSITIKKGIFFRQKFNVLYADISSICVEKRLFLLPFRASAVLIDTNYGSHKKSDIKMTISNKDIDTFVLSIKEFSEADIIRFSYYPSKRHLVFFSLIFSNTLSGAILISTLIYQGGQIIGQQLELQFVSTFNKLIRGLTFWLPPAAVGLSIFILGGWILSFVLNLMRHWHFKAERQGQNVVVTSGFLTMRTYYLNSAKINYTDFRQSLLTIIFKLSSVHVHCSGYGKAKRAIAVLIPITTRHEAFGTLHMLLPNLPEPYISVRSDREQIRRFIFIPVVFILSIPLVALTLIWLFPRWIEMIVFAGIIFEIPALWLLVVKIVSDFTTGIGLSDNVLTLKYCQMYEFHTALVPIEKISMFEIKQSVFQKKTNNCNLIIYTNAERTKFHVVRYLQYDKTLALLGDLDIQIYE